MAGQKTLETFRHQQRFLHIVRVTGRFKDGYTFLNVSKKSFERYCQKDPDFYKEACDAKIYYQVMRQARFGAALKAKALAELAKRIENGTATDKTLLTVLFQEPPMEALTLLTPPIPSLQDDDGPHGASLAAEMLEQFLLTGNQGYNEISPDLLLKIHKSLLAERLTGETAFLWHVNALNYLDDTVPDATKKHVIESFLQQYNDYVKWELAKKCATHREVDKLPH
jgi:hypothetical protein